MVNPSGRHFIDGVDLWTNYGMIVESGSDDFLKFPARKDSITHDWQDANGQDVDLSRVFFEDRDITLQMAIIVQDKATFWANWKAFMAMWAQPGTRRLTIAEFEQSFFVFYKSCSAFTRFTRILEVDKIACKFTIVVNEPAPTFDNTDVFIVDEDGRFLVT